MQLHSTIKKRVIPYCMSFLLVFLLLGLFSVRIFAANLPGLNVVGVGGNGNESPISAYRWLVEEDKTYHVQTFPDGTADPTTFDPHWDQLNDSIPGGETLAVGFHRSYMPVVAKGCVGFDDVVGFVCSEVAPAVSEPHSILGSVDISIYAAVRKRYIVSVRHRSQHKCQQNLA